MRRKFHGPGRWQPLPSGQESCGGPPSASSKGAAHARACRDRPGERPQAHSARAATIKNICNPPITKPQGVTGAPLRRKRQMDYPIRPGRCGRKKFRGDISLHDRGGSQGGASLLLLYCFTSALSKENLHPGLPEVFGGGEEEEEEKRKDAVHEKSQFPKRLPGGHGPQLSRSTRSSASTM